MRSFRSDTSQEEGGGGCEAKKKRPRVGGAGRSAKADGRLRGRAGPYHSAKQAPNLVTRPRPLARLPSALERSQSPLATRLTSKFLFGPPAALETLTNIQDFPEGRKDVLTFPKTFPSDRDRGGRGEGRRPANGACRSATVCAGGGGAVERGRSRRSRSRFRKGRRVDRAEADHKGASSPSRAAAP